MKNGVGAIILENMGKMENQNDERKGPDDEREEADDREEDVPFWNTQDHMPAELQVAWLRPGEALLFDTRMSPPQSSR